MIYDPRDRRHHFNDLMSKWPEHMRRFLRDHFRAWDGYRSLDDPCLQTARLIEEISLGKKADLDLLKPAIAKLESCGFHSIGSFTRTEPTWQLTYVVPFFTDFFGLEKDTAPENVWYRCNDEYLNLKRVATNNDGDLAQARKFFLDLNLKGNLELRDPIRAQHLAEA